MKRTKADRALAKVRSICMALEGTEEIVSHGAPCFRRKRLYAMFTDNHHGDGRVALWLRATHDVQHGLVEEDPERFFVPPYVGPSGWVGARLDRDPDWGMIEALLVEAHRSARPKAGRE